MNRTPPSEFDLIGLDSGRFRPAGVQEWHGPCPRCGGVDRFVIFTDRDWPSWNYFCRQCTPDGGWIDQLKPSLKQPLHPDIAYKLAEKAKLDLQRSIESAQKAMVELDRSQSHLRYHRALLENETAKLMWERAGVPDFWQEYWKLGFDPDRTIFFDGQPYQTPTLAIPIFEPISWTVKNIRHRLLLPPDPSDKYRPERVGLPSAPFVSDPDRDISGATLIVEGEKKAMVSFIAADNPDLQVVGLPGKNYSASMVPLFEKSDPVYICFDPGATSDAVALAGQLGFDRSRIIELPDKIDDLIIKYELSSDWMSDIIRNARKYKNWRP